VLVDEFKLCLTELEQEEDLTVVPVELLDPNVARIYSKSRRARVGVWVGGWGCGGGGGGGLGGFCGLGGSARFRAT